MKIERCEVWVVGPPFDRHSWSHDLPDQYQTLTLLRLFTDEGQEGIAGIWNATSFAYETYTAEALRHILPLLIGQDPMDRAARLHDIRPRVFPQPPGALSSIDVALWDLAAKAVGEPLYRYLGGARLSVPSYASTPMLDSVEAYVDLIAEMKEEGFSALKFHTWCLPDKDLALAETARKSFPDMTFMLDAENNYSREEALRVGHVLADLDFTWFEAPLHDSDHDGYRGLTAALGLPVIPSGNWIQDLPTFQMLIDQKTWSATRTDVTMMGGITPACEAMKLSAAAGLNCEVMCWGYTLPSAANLHVILAHENCQFYEQPLPYDFFEFAMDGAIRTGPDGRVNLPDKPGLGFEPDWQAMKSATIHRFDIS